MTHQYCDKKIMRKVGRLMALCLSFCWVTCAQQVPNPADCINDPTICAKQGPTWLCDQVKGQCTNGTCTTASDCVLPGAAVCGSSKLCEACSTDDQCVAWSMSRVMKAPLNFCVTTSDSNNTCGACRANTDCSDPASPICDPRSHSCSPCSVNSDCRDALNPVCDPENHLCRPCQANTECATGICRKPGDYPETPPPGIANGQCAQTSQLVFVNNTGTPTCADGNPGTQIRPVCTLGAAVALNKPFITVAGSTTPYPAVTVNSGSFVITGPGKTASPIATIAQLTVNNASVVISGVTLNHDVADTNTVVSCNGGGSAVYVIDSGVGPSGGRGIDAFNDCGKLYVERSAIFGNSRIGIYAGGFGAVTTQFRIVNNALTYNGTAGGNESDGVAIGMSASGYFAFNTLVANKAGIGCAANMTISDSIVANNSQFNVLNCNAVRVVTTFPDFVSNIAPDLRLLDTANNRSCCIDRGMVTPGQSVPTDYYGNKRPRGQGYDIGFSESF